jgi:hypothetical protein
MLLQNRIRSVVFANVMFLETTVAESVLLLLLLLLLTSSAKPKKKIAPNNTNVNLLPLGKKKTTHLLPILTKIAHLFHESVCQGFSLRITLVHSSKVLLTLSLESPKKLRMTNLRW